MRDVHHRLPAAAALTTSFYAAPQVPDDARRLFDAACASAGFDRDLPGPLPAARGAASSLILAREWGLTELEARLVDAIEAAWEPTWDRDLGEFTWGLGLDEPHPRGQYNAYLAAAEAAGPGRWAALSTAPVERCPQVVGVDFPAVALSRARWNGGALELALAPRRAESRVRTSFRIVGAGPGPWEVVGLDGATVSPDEDGGELTVEAPMVAAELTVRPAR